MGAEGEDERRTVSVKRKPNVFIKEAETRKKPKKADSGHEPSPIKKNNAASSPVAPETPSGSAPFPSPISSPSSSNQKNRPPSKDVRPLTKQSLSFEDINGTDLTSETKASPEATLLEHLEVLSKMEASVKTTVSVIRDLHCSLDSKFADAWAEADRGMKQVEDGLSKADRGMKQVEDGLSKIIKAQKLFLSPTSNSNPMPQE